MNTKEEIFLEQSRKFLENMKESFEEFSTLVYLMLDVNKDYKIIRYYLME